MASHPGNPNFSPLISTSLRLTFSRKHWRLVMVLASKGKHTIWAQTGFHCVGFCTEVEDVIFRRWLLPPSLRTTKIDPPQIRHLEVGSKTVIDNNKSIETFLMQVFEECGNTDGLNKCTLCWNCGSAALFNCVNWVDGVV